MYLLMWSKSYPCTYTKNEVKRSLWYLNFFCKKYIGSHLHIQYNKGVYISYYLPFDFLWFYLLCMPASTSLLILLTIVLCTYRVYVLGDLDLVLVYFMISYLTVTTQPVDTHRIYSNVFSFFWFKKFAIFARSLSFLVFLILSL